MCSNHAPEFNAAALAPAGRGAAASGSAPGVITLAAKAVPTVLVALSMNFRRSDKVIRSLPTSCRTYKRSTPE
jgi:hypothetical protein